MADSSDNPRPEEDYPHHDITRHIIGACFAVDATLGYGFLEPVYRRAVVIELEYRGISARQEVPFELAYRGVPIGVYRADLVVESLVIVEVKAGLLLDPAAIPQALNYLRASQLTVALVVHFGPRVKVKRVVATKHRDGETSWSRKANADGADERR